jgi:hypothetical protein
VQQRGIFKSRALLNGSLERGIKVIQVASDRKVNVDILSTSSGHDGSACGMVKSVLDVPEGVTGELANLVRNGGHLELEQCLSGLRIELSSERIGIISEKSFTCGLKALDVFVSPTK